jgi:hypothetical protein
MLSTVLTIVHPTRSGLPGEFHVSVDTPVAESVVTVTFTESTRIVQFGGCATKAWAMDRESGAPLTDLDRTR